MPSPPRSRNRGEQGRRRPSLVHARFGHVPGILPGSRTLAVPVSSLAAVGSRTTSRHLRPPRAVMVVERNAVGFHRDSPRSLDQEHLGRAAATWFHRVKRSEARRGVRLTRSTSPSRAARRARA